MRISEVIDILRKYKTIYGDLNVAFISNNGEKNIVNNIDVVEFSLEDDENIKENIAVIKDQFDYNQFTDIE